MGHLAHIHSCATSLSLSPSPALFSVSCASRSLSRRRVLFFSGCAARASCPYPPLEDCRAYCLSQGDPPRPTLVMDLVALGAKGALSICLTAGVSRVTSAGCQGWCAYRAYVHGTALHPAMHIYARTHVRTRPEPLPVHSPSNFSGGAFGRGGPVGRLSG